MRVFVQTSIAANDLRYLSVYKDAAGREYVRTGKGARVRRYLDGMRRETIRTVVVYTDNMSDVSNSVQ